MRIFDRDNKVNFVDDYNVVIGYDTAQDCCEYAGYSITATPPTEVCEDCPSESELLPYRIVHDEKPEVDSVPVSEGGSVCFRLVADGLPDLYLNLFNVHNGYYGHGFTVEVGGIQIRSDVL
jgi:hypothetical protein